MASSSRGIVRQSRWVGLPQFAKTSCCWIPDRRQGTQANGARATLSQEAVQEFQILKSGYAPEYGRASSAIINIASKQGTNQWRGDLFGYLRSRKVSAINAFAGEPDPGDTRVQAGATLGGPIRKDRTFGFLYFETTQANSTNFSEIGRDNFELNPSE